MIHANDHILCDAWLLDAASGAAPRAIRLLAACQADIRPEAGARLSAAEVAFGALLETAPIASLRPDALASALAQLDDGAETVPTPVSDPDPVIPALLKREMALSVSKHWRRRLGGHSEIVLDSLSEPGVKARLLSIPPGKGAPEHGHEGEELTLVLSGSFHDGEARYGRGDACYANADTIHTPRVDGDETCICFAVELGALKPTNPALAAANRVISIL